MSLWPSILRARPSHFGLWQQRALLQSGRFSSQTSSYTHIRKGRTKNAHALNNARPRCERTAPHWGSRCMGVTANVTNTRGSNDDVIWLQRADKATVKMAVAHKQNILHYEMSVTINTTKPLQEHHYPKLFHMFYKKVPPLRTCLRERDGLLWLCEMKEPKIDFEMCEGSDLTAEISKLSAIGFRDSTQGPLWRARVFPGDGGTTHVGPDVKETFPHQTTIIMSFHHGILDGVSAFVAAVSLMELVDALVDGSPIDEETQVGRIAGDEQTRPLVKDMRARLERDPERLRSLVNQRLEASFVPLINEAFGWPQVSVPKTLVLEGDIESSSFERFAELCRNAGVTFNAGMTAAINIALVELVRAAGLVKDKYDVTSRHAVNLRRYWKREPTFGFGCHIGGVLQTVDVPVFTHDAFWSYAKSLGEEQREMLVNQKAFEEVVVKDIILEESLKKGEPTSATYNVVCDYFLSNLYSGAESTFPGENIRLSRLYYGNTHHNWDYAACHVITAFGGNIAHYFSYCNTHMSEETASAFMEATRDVIMRLLTS